MELSLLGAKVPGMDGTFAPRSENVLELSFPGAKASWNFRSREQKSCGTFALSKKLLD